MTWLLKKRFGGNPAGIEGMFPVRDKVIENAQLKEGNVLLDVGTGDGLIGCAALEKVGANGKVIFSDISQDALDYCKEFANEVNALDQTDFALASAADLSRISDASVDVVTTRSVLIYELNKKKAFEEFYRVLKPDGRISLFEPIAKVVSQLQKPNTYLGYDALPIKDLFKKVMKAFTWNNNPDNPMGDFDERDLVNFAVAAGFSHAKADLEIQVGKAGMFAGQWDRFYNASMNPNAPTLREAVEQQLSDEEAMIFVEHMRPLVEAGDGWVTQVLCYLTASK